MIRFRIICSIFLISNLLITVSCCNHSLDCFISQYRRLKSDCSNRFDPNGSQEMNDFFKSKRNCSHIFELIGDKDLNSKLTDSLKNIDLFSIKSYIRLHYATTYVNSRITNRKNIVANADFSISFPKGAFISNFLIEIDGKLHKSTIFKRTDPPGKTQNRENLRNFQISIELQPNSTANFHLMYEELLQRHKGSYELTLHIHPGRIIKNLNAEIYINERESLTSIQIPLLKKTTQQIDQNNPELDPQATIQQINPHSVLIKFQPNEIKQKALIQALHMAAQKGLDALFSVRYDVQRSSAGGIFLTDGCHFVHFFAPEILQPLPKHVIFVLDTSTSMHGKRLEQLSNAMKQILPQLKQNDIFNIIHFGNDVYVDDIKNNNGFVRYLEGKTFKGYKIFHDRFKDEQLPAAVPATAKNLAAAIQDVQTLKAQGGTNLIGGIQMALLIVKRSQQSPQYPYKPLIVIITDGEPNEGIKSHDEIIKLVTTYNADESSIFCFGLGGQVQQQFLEKLSSLNRGKAQYIADVDAAKQLQGFFEEVSTPILDNIQFKYNVDATQITNTFFPIFFKGSELIVAGKIGDSVISPHVIAHTNQGKRQFIPQFGQSTDSLDRIWAYLTITQNIDQMANNIVSDDLLQKTMNLALKYSFTTQLTSLLVNRPNGTFVYDNTLIKPSYQPCCNLYLVPINVIKAEIRRIKFPVELSTITSEELLKKVPKIVENNLINMLPQVLGSMFH